jgi:hypothetical protein
MGEKPRHYISYMLRIWQAREDEDAVWRCSLENSNTREVHVFLNLGEMNSYLTSETKTLALRNLIGKQGDSRGKKSLY